ncbi:hypothetical protein NOC27_2409 [Nitrosococcus oceani AFC27]|nr:hypothetical protein NOC27_2409 [Nitrosococcus oceani AFC27]
MARDYCRPVHGKQHKLEIFAFPLLDHLLLERNQKREPQIPEQVKITTISASKILLDHNLLA